MVEWMFSRSRLALTLLAATSSKTLATSCVAAGNSIISRWNTTRTFTTAAPADAVEQHQFVHEAAGDKENRRIFFYPVGAEKTEENRISPWHDIPLFRDLEKKTFNYVNEIPKGTRPKMEIATKEPLSPIKQDVKNGQLRHFTYGDIPFNYGALPQTWEDPNEVDHDLKLGGDNDPLDVVELSPGPLTEGGVYEVKAIGLMALIDEGEVDWKVLAVNVRNPVAACINDSVDLENVMPGMEHIIREWFRNYKLTDGKPKNSFGFDERLLDKSKAMAVIEHTHEAWRKLTAGESDKGKLWIPEKQ